MRRSEVWFLVTLLVLSLAAACSRANGIVTALPTQLPQSSVPLEPTAMLDSEVVDSTPACPAARGDGTVSPDVSIYSITFAVNGLEQVVRAGDTLDAMPGDELEVREITICTEDSLANRGEVCVDLAPLDQNGQEIMSEHKGTHMVRMVSGFMTISGPSFTWTVGENWRQISAVLNHWPPEDTEDLDCGNRRCEHDDRIVIDLR